MERGSAFWTYDDEAGAWYLGLDDRSPPPITSWMSKQNLNPERRI